MDNFFPIMIERPENRLMGGGLTYWFLAFSLFPCLMFLMAVDLYGYNEWIAWVEIIYHIVNFIVVLVLFFTFMKDSFLILQVNTKQILSIACTCAIVIIVLKRALIGLFAALDWELAVNVAIGSYVSSESDLLRFAGDILYTHPILGSVVLVLMVPFSISCLYYACCFAPACNRWPRGAYLIISLALLIPRFMNFCPLSEELAIYFITLPVHLIACWSYQKTDTIWTPILIHGITNLIACILMLHVFGHI